MNEIESKNKVKRILCIWGSADLICKEKSERVFELKKLCDEAGDIKSFIVTDMPRTNNYSSHIESSVIKNVDVYQKTIFKLQQDINDILSIKALIDSKVSFLKGDEKKIITLRYKDGLSWDYIPDIIHKSRMQCFRIHNNVIRKFNDELTLDLYDGLEKIS